MTPLLESVPNFSEGRRGEVIDRIRDAANVPGVKLLDLHADADHNRMVLTLVGESDPLQEAVFRAARVATELIDLRAHTGEHPRVGATDVVPFIPIGNSTPGDALAAARSFGQRVASDLNIPVYFYESAATTPARTNLENVRRKGFEELRDTIKSDPERSPDLGPAAIHPTAGAMVVGARGPLVAYNVYLATTNLEVAKQIAKAIRHSSGGLRYVKALGIDVPAQGQVQVSMNLTNYRRSALHTVFELVRVLAESHGVAVARSEVVGLVPMDALIDAARFYLRLHEFSPEQILETRLFGE